METIKCQVIFAVGFELAYKFERGYRQAWPKGHAV